jgi:hypothetical protein
MVSPLAVWLIRACDKNFGAVLVQDWQRLEGVAT